VATVQNSTSLLSPSASLVIPGGIPIPANATAYEGRPGAFTASLAVEPADPKIAPKNTPLGSPAVSVSIGAAILDALVAAAAAASSASPPRAHPGVSVEVPFFAMRDVPAIVDSVRYARSLYEPGRVPKNSPNATIDELFSGPYGTPAPELAVGVSVSFYCLVLNRTSGAWSRSSPAVLVAEAYNPPPRASVTCNVSAAALLPSGSATVLAIPEAAVDADMLALPTTTSSASKGVEGAPTVVVEPVRTTRSITTAQDASAPTTVPVVMPSVTIPAPPGSGGRPVVIASSQRAASVLLPPDVQIPNRADPAVAAKYPAASDFATSVVATNVDARARPPPVRNGSFASPMIQVKAGRAIADSVVRADTLAAQRIAAGEQGVERVLVDVKVPLFDLRTIPSVVTALVKAR
jgi:hypothetical protein